MTVKKRGNLPAPVFGTRWSAEDIRYLRKYAGKIPAQDIATHLGRTRVALRFRANLLKIFSHSSLCALECRGYSLPATTRWPDRSCRNCQAPRTDVAGAAIQSGIYASLSRPASPVADGINLGLTKMAEACPGTSFAKLSWLSSWHMRDETYAQGLAALINYQHRLPFAANWGEGTTSSSDGQRFRAGGRGEAIGHVNARYGDDPGVLFYTHVSDQYGPYHTNVIHSPIRDATYVLDGSLYHESELRIEEHYTDTAGFTDHVFALCPLIGFRFAPRIRDLADKRLYFPGKSNGPRSSR